MNDAKERADQAAQLSEARAEVERLKKDVQNDYKALWETDSAKLEKTEAALEKETEAKHELAAEAENWKQRAEDRAAFIARLEREVEKLWRTVNGQTRELADWSTRTEKAEAALEQAHDILRSLASFVGSGGYNAEQVNPATFEAKVRDGIERINRVEFERGKEEGAREQREVDAKLAEHWWAEPGMSATPARSLNALAQAIRGEGGR